MPSTAPATLHPLSQEIQSRLELARDLPARLERPNLPAVRESAAVFWECFHALSAHAHLGTTLARVIDFEALYRSFNALLAFRTGEAALTASALLEAWLSASQAELRALEGPESTRLDFATSLRRELEAAHGDLAEGLSVAFKEGAAFSQRSEWLVLFHQATEQIVTSLLAADQGRTSLRSLMARLELSQDDLGRMFGVSGETIRRWERGQTTIPAERRSAILAAESGLRRLQDLLRPSRLPTTIRRNAELFDGESALDWILRGRIAEVADRYEEALLYQA